MRIASPLRRGACLLAVALLAACATPASIQPGEPAAMLTSRYGSPTVQQPRPEGGERLLWSGQPMGQFAWAADVGPDGKVLRAFQALTSERFAMLDQGQWNTDRLVYEFGPPAQVTRVGLKGESIVWEYRFKEDGVWNSLMYIYVDGDGKVTKHHPGPDPLYERQRFPFF